MPAPRPRFEIFVYSPRVEGVHLRFGAGRPRRPALVGPAAGLPHRDPRPGQGPGGEERGDRAGRGEGRVRRAPARGRATTRSRPATGCSSPGCSTSPTTSSPTDGRSATVPPPDVVRHDGDDAYLVVAADKGTAKFSDIANEVAASYGFWLGDAFASGGSVGYDHKAMGITATRRVGERQAALPRAGRRHPERGVHRRRHRRHVRRRVRQRHAALPRTSGWSRRSTTGTCSSTPTRTPRAGSPSGSGCSRCRARRGTTTTATRSARAAGCGRARRSRCRSAPEIRAALGLDDDVTQLSPPELIRGDPARPGRPAVERRHRHLRQGVHRGDPRRRGRQGQRRRPGRRQRAARQGRRRGRQPGPHPARPHRVRPRRREDQHRRDRQLGGRRLLRPRGQHQDPARPAGRGRRRWTATRATRCWSR